MNLKNIFFRKEIVKEENEEKEKNEEQCLNGPNIILRDKDLMRFIGRWLHLVDYYNDDSFVTSETKKKIKDYFGHILSLIGFSDDDTCTLSNLNKEEKTFTCHFKSTDENAKIRLCHPGDFGPQFRIYYKNTIKTYFYYGMYNDNYDNIKFDEYDIETDNNTRYERVYGPITSYIHLKDKDEQFTMEVENYEYSDNIFLLPGEEEIQKYFCELTFPIDIAKLYKKLLELTSGKIKEYKKLKLENVYGYNQYGHKGEVTDLILLEEGILKKFVITRNDITVTINEDGSWMFYSSDVSVSKSKKGSISYSVEADSQEEIEKHDISDNYDDAENKVKEIRKLIKSLNL